MIAREGLCASPGYFANRCCSIKSDADLIPSKTFPHISVQMGGMEILVLMVFGTLCAGLMMVMYQKNAELFEAIERNEVKIRELEKGRNSVEQDSLIRQRLSTTESRVTALERLIKTHSGDLDKLKSAGPVGQETSGGATGVDTAAVVQQQQVLSNQILFVNERVTKIATQFDQVNNAQLYLASKAVIAENANVCVFSNTENCPPHMRKFATFGIIGHSGDMPIPTGYYQGGPFNDNGWNWIHGGLCCPE